MKRLLFVMFVLVAACKNESLQNKEELKSSSSKTENAIVNSYKKNCTPLVRKEELLGNWKDENKELLTVKIDKDSIYYVEHFESHRYKTKADSIFINYPNFVYAAKVCFINDTLIMQNENGDVIYTRIKN